MVTPFLFLELGRCSWLGKWGAASPDHGGHVTEVREELLGTTSRSLGSPYLELPIVADTAQLIRAIIF